MSKRKREEIGQPEKDPNPPKKMRTAPPAKLYKISYEQYSAFGLKEKLEFLAVEGLYPIWEESLLQKEFRLNNLNDHREIRKFSAILKKVKPEKLLPKLRILENLVNEETGETLVGADHEMLDLFDEYPSYGSIFSDPDLNTTGDLSYEQKLILFSLKGEIIRQENEAYDRRKFVEYLKLLSINAFLDEIKKNDLILRVNLDNNFPTLLFTLEQGVLLSVKLTELIAQNRITHL